MQKNKKVKYQNFQANVKKSKFWILNPPANPWIVFFKPDTLDVAQYLASYHHAKNQKNHSSVSEKKLKNLIFDTQSPPNPWIIFFKTRYPGQMLHSVGLYHHAKNLKKILVDVAQYKKTPYLLTFNPLLIPGLFYLKPNT